MFYGIIETCKLHYRSGNIRYSAIGKKSKIDEGGCSDNLSNYPAAVFYAIRNYSVMFHSVKNALRRSELRRKRQGKYIFIIISRTNEKMKNKCV